MPSFYERDAAGLPQGWIAKMRASMGGLPPIFNTDRMVHEYLSRYYAPAAQDLRSLSDGGLAQARELSAWIDRVREEWPNVQVTRVGGVTEAIPAGTAFGVEADVELGNLSQDEVDVYLAHGLLDADGALTSPTLTALTFESKSPSGVSCYSAQGVRGERSGRHGYAIRITPRHPSLPSGFQLGLVRWSD